MRKPNKAEDTCQAPGILDNEVTNENVSLHQVVVLLDKNYWLYILSRILTERLKTQAKEALKLLIQNKSQYH